MFADWVLLHEKIFLSPNGFRNEEDREVRTQESKERFMDMVRMRLEGYKLNEIAKKYGVSKQCA